MRLDPVMCDNGGVGGDDVDTDDMETRLLYMERMVMICCCV